MLRDSGTGERHSPNAAAQVKPCCGSFRESCGRYLFNLRNSWQTLREYLPTFDRLPVNSDGNIYVEVSFLIEFCEARQGRCFRMLSLRI